MLMPSIIVIFIVMLIALLRAFRGTTHFDRILAVNVFGTKTVLFISVLGFASGRPHFLDIAMVYALLNFISIVGVLRFFEYETAQRQDKD